MVSVSLIFSFWQQSTQIVCFVGLNFLIWVAIYFFARALNRFESWNKVKLWNQIFNSLILASGMANGSTAIVAARQFEVAHIDLIQLIMSVCGVGVASLIYLRARAWLNRAYCIVLMGPIVLGFPYSHTSTHYFYIPVFFLVYIIYNWNQAKRSEVSFLQKLTQSEFLQNIINSIPLSIMARSFDNERRIALINPMAQKIWGLSGSVVGQKPDEVFSPEVALIFQSQDSLAREYKEPVKFPDTSFTLNGKTRIISKTLIFLKDSRLILEIAEDQTEIKNAQREIQDLQNYNLQTAKMATLGEMAGGVAHEINNPLAIIMGKAEQIKNEIRKPNVDLDQLEQNTDKIVHTTKRISRIVQGLLSFSRTGEKEALEITSVQSLINESFLMIKEKFDRATIDFRIAPFEDFKIECQNMPVAQALINLLSNAFDAIETLDDRWVEIAVQDLDEDFAILVTDSGKGIHDPEVKEKLMRPFFTTKNVGKGVGLGLSICKGVVEEHNGEFYLNEESKNTQFVMILPKSQKSKFRQAA